MKIQYVRDENNHPFGVMVAVKNEKTATVHVGYSVCREGDRWDKQLGVLIARQRALRGRNNHVPEKIADRFLGFVDHLHGRREYEGWRLPSGEDFKVIGPHHRS